MTRFATGRRNLHVSPTLSLSVQTVTGVVGIVGRRNSGKTSTGIVFIEEMLRSKLQVVLLDAQGVGWGLRVGKNGLGKGLPITIFGGLHKDVPLDSGVGALIADLLVDERISAVLDVSGFGSNETQRFMTDFAERLFKRKGEKRDPLYLIIDEAQRFVPQRPLPGQQRMLGAMEHLVLSGRNRGIGTMLITQRPATVNKNVLSQIDTLIAMRLMAPQDKDAVGSWLKDNLDEADRAALMRDIVSFKSGTGYVWAPALDLSEIVHFRKSDTFDARRSPEPHQVKITPRILPQNELKKLQEKMASVIERQKATDPTELQRENAKLKAELARRNATLVVDAKAAAQIAKMKPGKLEPVIPKFVQAQIDGFISKFERDAKMAKDATAKTIKEMRKAFHSFAQNFEKSLEALAVFAESGAKIDLSKLSELKIKYKPLSTPQHGVVTKVTTIPREPFNPNGSAASAMASGDCKAKIMTALLAHPEGLNITQLSFYTGFKRTSRYFQNQISALRTAGLIVGSNTAPMKLINDGSIVETHMNGVVAPDDLYLFWLPLLGADSCSGKILTAMKQTSMGLNINDLAEATGFEATSRYFQNQISALRTQGIVVGRNAEGMKLAPEFYQ
jgi:uncharacterized protein